MKTSYSILILSCAALTILGAGCSSSSQEKAEEDIGRVTLDTVNTAASTTSVRSISEKDIINRLANEYNAVPNWGKDANFSADLVSSIPNGKYVAFSGDLEDIGTNDDGSYLAVTWNDSSRSWKGALRVTNAQVEEIKTANILQEKNGYESPRRFVFIASIDSVQNNDQFQVIGRMVAFEPSGNTSEASFIKLF